MQRLFIVQIVIYLVVLGQSAIYKANILDPDQIFGQYFLWMIITDFSDGSLILNKL